MRAVLLINPNTSAAATAMMVAVARRLLPSSIGLHGIGAARGVEMILDETALAASEVEVLRIGLAAAAGVDAVIVAAFGDPGVAALRTALRVPVIGIGEAALREAAAGGRRFSIATTTPGLKASIEARVRHLLPDADFTGVRLSIEDPMLLAANPASQSAALHRAVAECVERDGAEAVVIGGGPLTDAAAKLRRHFGPMIVEPVSAALRVVLQG